MLGSQGVSLVQLGGRTRKRQPAGAHAHHSIFSTPAELNCSCLPAPAPRLLQNVSFALSTLPKRERNILRMRYGLLQHDEEVADPAAALAAADFAAGSSGSAARGDALAPGGGGGAAAASSSEGTPQELSLTQVCTEGASARRAGMLPPLAVYPLLPLPVLRLAVTPGWPLHASAAPLRR